MRKIGHHKYWAEEQAGRRAHNNTVCPFGIWEIGRRCAWLAGYRDARSEVHE